MNEVMSTILLLSVPGLPLLLAFPVLRAYFPRPCYLALLPVIILVAMPVPFSLEIPWLLLGTGLGIDELSRLLSVMSVVLWVASAAFLHASAYYSSEDRIITYFMLTLAGNLGVILATDLMSFFVFLTLTGYGFYALSVSGQGKYARQSGRVYLGFMIIADLVLFEALLIAAVITDDLGFEAVHYAMAQSSSSGLYLSMVFIGFALKAALWPLHFWLTDIFRSSRPAVTILLAGVPIAVSLLGMLRWLPLGEITAPEIGVILQSLGVMAIVYAIIAGLIKAQLIMLPVYVVIFGTGLFTLAVGVGLAEPELWNLYAQLLYFFIAFLGIAFAILVSASRRLQSKYNYCIVPENKSGYLSRYFKQYWPSDSIHLLNQNRIKSLSCMTVKTDYYWYSSGLLWKKILAKGEYFFRHWNVAITLLFILGIAVVLTGVFSGNIF